MSATPMPYMHSPVPGTLSPATLSPVPTTLGAAAGQATGPKKTKAGIFIAGALVVAAAVTGVIIVVNRGGGESSAGTSSAGGGSSTTTGTGSATTQPQTGSATTQQTATNTTGSATTQPQTGSATTTSTGSASTGSATTQQGSATVKPPEWTMSNVSVTSTPADAEIIVKGYPTAKTPSEITIPRGTAKEHITLKLDGYEDKTLDVVPDAENKKLDFGALKPKKHGHGPTGPIGQGHGSAAGKGSGAGKGSASQTVRPNTPQTGDPDNIMRP
jgi:hypothetical protein